MRRVPIGVVLVAVLGGVVASLWCRGRDTSPVAVQSRSVTAPAPVASSSARTSADWPDLIPVGGPNGTIAGWVHRDQTFGPDAIATGLGPSVYDVVGARVGYLVPDYGFMTTQQAERFAATGEAPYPPPVIPGPMNGTDQLPDISTDG